MFFLCVRECFLILFEPHDKKSGKMNKKSGKMNVLITQNVRNHRHVSITFSLKFKYFHRKTGKNIITVYT